MEWEQDCVKWIKKLKAVIGIVAYYLKRGKRMNKDKLIQINSRKEIPSETKNGYRWNSKRSRTMVGM